MHAQYFLVYPQIGSFSFWFQFQCRCFVSECKDPPFGSVLRGSRHDEEHWKILWRKPCSVVITDSLFYQKAQNDVGTLHCFMITQTACLEEAIVARIDSLNKVKAGSQLFKHGLVLLPAQYLPQNHFSFLRHI